MSLPSLRLKANADRRLRAGHLWVYSNEVDVAATPLNLFQPGEWILWRRGEIVTQGRT